MNVIAELFHLQIILNQNFVSESFNLCHEENLNLFTNAVMDGG